MVSEKVTYEQKPNFLASEVGLVLKTYGLDATVTGAETENGRSIIPAGLVIAGKGIVFQDIDVTGATATTQVPATIMIAGWVYEGKVDGDVSGFDAIHVIAEPAVTR